MQLKTPSVLALAATSLLGGAVVSAAEWEHEASVLYYGESDDRVQDGSVKYSVTRTSDEGDELGLNIGVDSLTGASPNGVVPSYETQTLTSPSGKGTITHPAGELPLDSSFKDTRVAGSVFWAKDWFEDVRGTLGASFSQEYDYSHLGVNGSVSRSLNNKNTTVSVGLALANDTFDAVGNIPVPLSADGSAKGAGSDTKTVVEGMIGVTQVLGKDLIGQFNYGISQTDGYQNDPYKFVSAVDATGSITEHFHEGRPDSRLGHNLYGALKYKATDKLTSTSSARFHTDDWGIDSLTLDQKFRFDIGNKRSIEPHFRYYTQSAADFYAVQLNDGDALPVNVSADYRLSEFAAYTLGVTYRWEGIRDSEWRITGEVYQQIQADQTLTAGQAGLDATPGFTAGMVSLGFKF